MLFSVSAPKLWILLCKGRTSVIQASDVVTASEQLLMLKGDIRKLLKTPDVQ